eukprot:466327_1
MLLIELQIICMATTSEKRDLMRLSKAEIIKRCKKARVNNYTSKSKKQMINTLLSTKKYSSRNLIKQKKSNANHMKLPKLTKPKNIFISQPDDIHEYIVSGYIKNIVRKTPSQQQQITSIIIEYLGTMIRKFDIAPGEFLIDIKNNGTLIKRDKHIYEKPKNKEYKTYHRKFLFGCSNGCLPNTGLNKLKIRINKLKHRQDSIGIISDIKYLSINEKYNGKGIILPKNVTIDSVKCNSYYLPLCAKDGRHHIQSGSATNDKYKCSVMTNSAIQIEVNDVIQICLDTDNWKLNFERNGKQYHDEKINVDGNCIYYFAIGSHKHGNEYELL